MLTPDETNLLNAWHTLPAPVQNLLYACMRTYRAKGSDYRRGSVDHLANFKFAAKQWGITPLQSWGNLCGKHWDAVAQYVKTGGLETEPLWKRIQDVIVYMTLLLMFVVEANGDLPPEIGSYDPTKDA